MTDAPTPRIDHIAGDIRPHAGATGAYIHFSTDGTRVLLYSEWTSEAAHRDAIESGVLGGKRGIFDGIPHIEGFGFDRYTLYRRLARPSERRSTTEARRIEKLCALEWQEHALSRDEPAALHSR